MPDVAVWSPTPDAWPNAFGTIFAYLAGVFALAEGLNRWLAIDSELTRKIVHIGTGNVIGLAWWLQLPAWLGVAASASASLLALLSYFVAILPSINSVGRKSLGTFCYAVSFGVLFAWFWPLGQPQYAVMGVGIMCWGDGLAALVGRYWGRHRYRIGGMTKSWEGSLIMAAITYGISSAVLVGTLGNMGAAWLASLAVAALATGLEAVSQWGIDNLTVPLGSAALGFGLGQWLG